MNTPDVGTADEELLSEVEDRSFVIGDPRQREELSAVGITFAQDASLRPLLTVVGRDRTSRKVIAVLLTEPDTGPCVDDIVPWVEASGRIVADMEKGRQG